MKSITTKKPEKCGFPPISCCNAVVIILGSLPGQKSLEDGEYYAQAKNAFWRIMGSLFDFTPDLSYRERKLKLIKNRVALWDVLKTAQRQGSFDSSIVASSVVPNDFRWFLKSHPDINLVCFNGSAAEKWYRSKVLPSLCGKFQGIRYERLPSTSSANTAMAFEKKLDQWKIVKSHMTCS